MNSRILFLISNYSASNTGHGGHFYSVRDIASALSRSHEVRVVVIGDRMTPVLDSIPIPVTFVSIAHQTPTRAIREVEQIAKEFRPTHVHSFDNKSHFFGRIVSKRVGAKCFLTKPGGPNAGLYFPWAPAIVCFSSENLVDLQRRRRLRDAEFWHIPQRVLKARPDHPRIAGLMRLVGPGNLLLRIARIGEFHRMSILQTLALASSLREAGIDIRALVIGAVEDQEVYEEVVRSAGTHDHVITEAAYTVNAAQLLDMAAAVVGTGRSLIEGALSRKIIFAPLRGMELPVLVTPSNYRELLRTNFSARSELPVSLVPPPSAAAAAVRSGDIAGASAVADELDLEVALPVYEDLYSSSQEWRAPTGDLLINGAVVLVQYWRSASRRRRTR